MRIVTGTALIALIASCSSKQEGSSLQPPKDSITTIKPVVISDAVRFDSDDQAFWIDSQDPAQSLVVGTDKGGDAGDGALYVFVLHDREISDTTVRNIKRPNNVDVAYGLMLNNKKV